MVVRLAKRTDEQILEPDEVGEGVVLALVPNLLYGHNLRLRLLREDHACNRRSRLKWTFFAPGFQAIAVYRLGVWCNGLSPALVRAPLRASDADIARFVDSHRGWLEKHLAARQAYLSAHPEPSAAQTDAWRQQAKETLPPLVAHWAQRMGVQPAGITITAARTRFGSCSGKNRLSFSLYLMAYPETAIEYVVVHELAHRLEMNHSDRFWKIVESQIPDYKERRNLLKTYENQVTVME